MGSDTMVNLAQAWAEEYGVMNPSVSIEVSGGGSGTGIAALISGTVDIVNSSRNMELKEIEETIKNTGKEPHQFVVGYDALALFVHRENPIEEITIPQLAEIYGEDGPLTRWSQLGIVLPKKASDKIVVVSRQSNSGTYQYLREAILGKKDLRLGTLDMNGSKDVVELVSRTPGAIGYSGMGYATPQVKTLRIAKKSGEKAYAPTVATTLDGSYPIARPLFMITLGPPQGEIKKYLDYILSGSGQEMVARSGYVPLKHSEMNYPAASLPGRASSGVSKTKALNAPRGGE